MYLTTSASEWSHSGHSNMRSSWSGLAGVIWASHIWVPQWGHSGGSSFNVSRIDADRPMEPPAVFTGGSTSLSATDAWAEPLSVIQNSALKMIEKSIFSNCAQALAWYFHDGRAMTVKGGSSRRCSRERGGSSSARLSCNRYRTLGMKVIHVGARWLFCRCEEPGKSTQAVALGDLSRRPRESDWQIRGIFCDRGRSHPCRKQGAAAFAERISAALGSCFLGAFRFESVARKWERGQEGDRHIAMVKHFMFASTRDSPCRLRREMPANHPRRTYQDHCNASPISLYGWCSRLRLHLQFRLLRAPPKTRKIPDMRTHANGLQGEQRLCASK